MKFPHKPHVCLGILLTLASTAIAQTSTITSASAANSSLIVSPDSIVSAWGTNLTTTTVAANTISTGAPVSLPTTLGNTNVGVKDSAAASVQAPLYMVSPSQINYVLPASVAIGVGTVTVTSPASMASGSVLVSTVAPGIFTVDGAAASIPAAQVVRVARNAIVSVDAVFTSTSGAVTVNPITISGSSSDAYYLMVYATGVRGKSLNPATATIGDVDVPVTYAGSQNQYPGFDQVNIGPLPTTLKGKGVVNLVIRADGVPSNTVKLTVQ